MVLKREMKIWKELKKLYFWTKCRISYHSFEVSAIYRFVTWLRFSLYCANLWGQITLENSWRKFIRHQEEGVWLCVKLISVKDAGSYWFNSVLVFFPIRVQFEDLWSRFNMSILLKHSSPEDVITRPFLTRFDSDLSQWVENLRTAPIGSLNEMNLESLGPDRLIPKWMFSWCELIKKGLSEKNDWWSYGCVVYISYKIICIL